MLSDWAQEQASGDQAVVLSLQKSRAFPPAEQPAGRASPMVLLRRLMQGVIPPGFCSRLGPATEKLHRMREACPHDLLITGGESRSLSPLMTRIHQELTGPGDE